MSGKRAGGAATIRFRPWLPWASVAGALSILPFVFAAPDLTTALGIGGMGLLFLGLGIWLARATLVLHDAHLEYRGLTGGWNRVEFGDLVRVRAAYAGPSDKEPILWVFEFKDGRAPVSVRMQLFRSKCAWGLYERLKKARPDLFSLPRRTVKHASLQDSRPLETRTFSHRGRVAAPLAFIGSSSLATAMMVGAADLGLAAWVGVVVLIIVALITLLVTLVEIRYRVRTTPQHLEIQGIFGSQRYPWNTLRIGWEAPLLIAGTAVMADEWAVTPDDLNEMQSFEAQEFRSIDARDLLAIMASRCRHDPEFEATLFGERHPGGVERFTPPQP